VFTYLTSALDDASTHQSRKIVAMYALLLAANVAIWTWALVALAGQLALLGTSFLAYVLGLRHAVDADHIAAIDNVVRKLMQEGKRPVSAGFTLMIFPALFTAGVTLVDTTDSVLMVGAYGWAFFNPLRKIWYNLTITAISVLVALLIGGVEALALIADKLELGGRFWTMVGNLNDDLGNFGHLVIAIFVGSRIVSYLIYHWQGFDRPAVERS
jgi:high-affinity nickel permease